MTQRKIRYTVVAAALAAVLALAAPAQAASHPHASSRSGWIETVWQWVAGVWGTGGGGKIDGIKSGYGIDPNGSTTTTPTTPTTQTTDPYADKGYGIDPNG